MGKEALRQRHKESSNNLAINAVRRKESNCKILLLSGLPSALSNSALAMPLHEQFEEL
jgi:hypothetical protein